MSVLRMTRKFGCVWEGRDEFLTEGDVELAKLEWIFFCVAGAGRTWHRAMSCTGAMTPLFTVYL